MNWYCIHTKPKGEQQVATYLTDRLGVETYFPRLRRQKTIRRVRRSVTGPLFPRYLFGRFDISTQYRAVRYAPEVIDIVNLGTRPAQVSDALIASLKHWAGEGIDLISIRSELSLGDRVEITDGPMRGLPATVLHIKDDNDRVAVLLTLLESSAKVHINRSQLSRIP